MLRLFVGIDLPLTIKNELLSLCHGPKYVNWVSRDKFHLTLQFIGDARVDMHKRIVSVLESIEFYPFELELDRPGLFGDRRGISVLWMGIQESEELLSLQQSVKNALEKEIILVDKKKFKPHITLGRVGQHAFANAQDFQEFLNRQQLGMGLSFEVKEFHLYSSKQSSSGIVYTKEASFHACM